MIPGLTLVIVLFGALYGVASVIYMAPRGYLGHSKGRKSVLPTAQDKSNLALADNANGVPGTVATNVSQSPLPSVQPIYEVLQPTVAPVQYATPFKYTASFGTPPISNKPTRTYRRKVARVRAAASRASLKPKTKKR